jgi:hypothetical protein
MSQIECTDREQTAEKKATRHKKGGWVEVLQNALWRFKNFCSPTESPPVERLPLNPTSYGLSEGLDVGVSRLLGLTDLVLVAPDPIGNAWQMGSVFTKTGT